MINEMILRRAVILTFSIVMVTGSGISYAFDMGNMMNPSKWFGGNRDRDRGDYYDDRWGGPGYGYGAPGYGYGGPGYGYGAPGYGYGGPGYGYGAPGYGYGGPGYGYGAPGYGYGAPGYGYGYGAPGQAGSGAPPPPQ